MRWLKHKQTKRIYLELTTLSGYALLFEESVRHLETISMVQVSDEYKEITCTRRTSHMLTMPANNSGAFDLYREYKSSIGMLFGPGAFSTPRSLPYALDNNRFSCWTKGKSWSEASWLKMLDKAESLRRQPLWVLVPDVVGDAQETYREWERYVDEVRSRNLIPALALQDGMTPDLVRHNCGNVEVVFVGGTTNWKRSTLGMWCRTYNRVHVGRINSLRWLWNCHRLGAESTDGTGWYRGGPNRLEPLLRYLKDTSGSCWHLCPKSAETFYKNLFQKEICSITPKNRTPIKYGFW